MKKKLKIILETDSQRMHVKDAPKSRKRVLKEYSGFEELNDYKNVDNLERSQNMYSAFYGGVDPRRRGEMAAGGMVKEDDTKMSNLSEKFIHREYPQFGYNSSPYIDDTMIKD